jgi:sucrose phosphorylase
MASRERISSLLVEIYGEQQGRIALDRLMELIAYFPANQYPSPKRFSHKDVILITYGNTLMHEEEPPLSVLRRFTDHYLKDIVTFIHLLPFFPFSSDDGFAVTDFTMVDPAFGDWKNIAAFKENFGLMFDWVLNHVSAKSLWFENYLSNKKGFGQLAIEVDPKTDLSQVIRPRTLPLLTPFKKKNGQIVYLWTTFSTDQIDLNYTSIDVLLKMLAVLLLYVKKGAMILRLDAVAYLWKEVGTSCIHHPKTHALVRLFRAVLDMVAPHVAIITETNVPHKENISYFGDDGNEAQMVYNFSLPSLLLYTFITEDSRIFCHWAENLQTGFKKAVFFNFTASHDGIGMRPLEGILTKQQMVAMTNQVTQNKGHISYKDNPDGTQSPYELNITYLDALRQKSDTDLTHIRRFLASQAIPLTLPGVPGIYIHSILGSRNWHEGVHKTGRARSINREKLQEKNVLAELTRHDSFRSSIFFPYYNLLRIRREQPAFHPDATCKILDIGPKAFGLTRENNHQKIYALTNISSTLVEISILGEGSSGKVQDLITQKKYTPARIRLLPHQTLWLR